MGKVILTSENAERLRSMLDAATSLQAMLRNFQQAIGPDRAAEEGNEHLRRAAFDAGAESASFGLSDRQKRLCERVINVFETGTVTGRYEAISIYDDGPGGRRQITYGRSQTTEYGNLRELVEMYAAAGGRYSADLRRYVARIGVTPLVDDATFKGLLRSAGADPVMRETQDLFFDKVYFQPALHWATVHGFSQALSILVVYDSYIHSGGILHFLRERFPEPTPDRGGDEKIWIRQYVDVRHAWLSNHSDADIRASNYRTKDLVREISRGNWDLSMLPFMANGTPLMDSAAGNGALAGAGLTAMAATEWSELEPPSIYERTRPRAAGAMLAARILNHPNITLANAHVSGENDQATAHQNIVDTGAGLEAHRSSYGTAPGGTVRLDPRMLQGLLDLADEYAFSVSELCGGEHSPGSRHYRGVTADVNVINDRHVSASHPQQAAFRRKCSSLGATQVFGPGDRGHSTHIHAAWPV
ncbi:chitosanase [Rhizobium johnstonii]|uniref:chitosanase n=1 Tax=Rhizobium johnstonii TaxID=3019933 RepID=UPI003F9B6EFD